MSNRRAAVSALSLVSALACGVEAPAPNLASADAGFARSGSGGADSSSAGAHASAAGSANGSVSQAGTGVSANGGATAGGTASRTAEAPGCDPKALWSSAPLRRLTSTQYQRVLRSVIEGIVPSLAGAAMSAEGVLAALKQLPDDLRATASAEKHGGFRRLDQDVAQDHVEASFAIARAVATELTRTPTNVEAMLGSCASDANAANDADCVRSFIRSAGARAHRRTLPSEDVDFYVSVYATAGISAPGIADVLTVLLSSPYFFYQVEHASQVVDATHNIHALDAEELAARLSLHFWNSVPDGALLDQARSGVLLSDAGFAQALERVRSDPKAKPVLEEFFREWLSAEDLQETDRFVGSPLFDAIRNGFVPGPDTRENLIAEAAAFGAYYATQPNGSFADLFTSKKSFAITTDVAQIYGGARWAGTGEPPDILDGNRSGVLTRAALLATGSPETQPIMKGVFLRTTLLCDVVPPPPQGAVAAALQSAQALAPVLSTRKRTEALTEVPGSGCATCHAGLINPLGFLTENYDSLGRLRGTQPIFDDKGVRLGEVEVDTSAVPQVNVGDMTRMATAPELARRMLESHKPQACFARKYFRFTFGRVDDPALDACAIAPVREGLVGGQPLGATLSRVASSAQFKQRRFD